MTLSVASLFAGIGGFDLAAERMGLRPVLQAEIDPSAQRVLRARYPHVQLIEDATQVDLRGIDLVTAGFPCQGLSSAATTRRHSGLLDPESISHVIWRTLDRVFEARPKYLLMENADALTSDKFSGDLLALIRRLEEAGYSTRVTTLNAGCYGSHMRRMRTFILAHLDDDWWRFDAPAQTVQWTARGDGIGVNNQQGGGGFSVQPSVTKMAGTYTLMVRQDAVLSFQPEGIESLFGFPRGWTSPAGSRGERYERLGNAVSVDCAEAALSLLLRGHAKTRAPATSYSELIGDCAPAGRGTAASALGRIMRSLDVRGGWKSPTEWDHCVPVYLQWVDEQPGELTEKMRGYIDHVRPLRAKEPMIAWPSEVRVVMSQG